jgi:hypothetical protein
MLVVILNVVDVDFVGGMHRQLPRDSDQAEVICNQIEQGVVVRAQANQVVEACRGRALHYQALRAVRSGTRARPRAQGCLWSMRDPGGNKALVTEPRALNEFEIAALADLEARGWRVTVEAAGTLSSARETLRA